MHRIHPTALAHQQVGLAIAAQIGAVPEPATWGMMVIGLGLAGALARWRRMLAAT